MNGARLSFKSYNHSYVILIYQLRCLNANEHLELFGLRALGNLKIVGAQFGAVRQNPYVGAVVAQAL